MTDAQHSTVDPEGIELRREFEHKLLRRMIRDLDDDALPHEKVCKYGRIYCQLRKGDADLDKNTVDVLIAEARLSAAHAPARRSQPEASARAKTAGDPFDHDAPYGRRPDGTPYTRAEFSTALNHAVRDIYGIPDFSANIPSSHSGRETSNEPTACPPRQPSSDPPPSCQPQAPEGASTRQPEAPATAATTAALDQSAPFPKLPDSS